MRLPIVTGSDAEYGRLCLGCVRTDNLAADGTLPVEVIATFATSDTDEDARRRIRVNAMRMWTEDEFPIHVQTCYGATLLRQEMQSN